MYYIYILKCSDNTLYTGITKNIEKRILEHNSSPLGAKYTRGRRPVRLLYSTTKESRSEATKEEYRIKKLSKTEKLNLIKSAK